VNPLQGTEQTALPGRLNPFYLDGRTITLLLPIAQQLGLRDGQIIQAALEMRGETLKLLYNGQLIDLPPGLRFRPPMARRKHRYRRLPAPPTLESRAWLHWRCGRQCRPASLTCFNPV
jgi:hypothetical protein